jgi:pimeloyl-ACP methyl ester carboxylesterase
LITKSDLIDVVLVGHSYGGGIITGAADCVPERIYALIYLDAIVPQNGVPDWVGFPRERQDSMRSGAERFGGLRVPPPDPSVWGIQPGTAEHRDLQQRLTPHPIKTMMDAPVLSERWQDVPRKHYLLAAGPPPSRFTGVHAALTGKPGWHTDMVAGGHEMMWTHPGELAAKLLAISDPQD